MSSRKRAFTLIELLVVVSIISLLSSVVLSQLNSAREKARIAAGRQFEANIHHAAGDMAVLILDMDECAGSSARDRSGTVSPGSFSGNTAWSSVTPAGTGCALSFDGTDDYVQFSDSAGHDFGAGQDFTISAWIRNTNSGSYQPILDKKAGTVGAYPGYMLRKNNLNRLNLIIRDTLGNETGVSSSKPINGDVWRHVAVTVDRDGLATLYIDGSPDGSQSVAALAGSLENSYGVRIGSTNFGTEDWSGLIDEVRMYAKTLTALEIESLYAQGAAVRELAVQ